MINYVACAMLLAAVAPSGGELLYKTVTPDSYVERHTYAGEVAGTSAPYYNGYYGNGYYGNYYDDGKYYDGKYYDGSYLGYRYRQQPVVKYAEPEVRYKYIEREPEVRYKYVQPVVKYTRPVVTYEGPRRDYDDNVYVTDMYGRTTAHSPQSYRNLVADLTRKRL